MNTEKTLYVANGKDWRKWLVEHDLIHSSILEKAKQIASEKYIFPKDIIEAIKKNKIAWKNYTKFSDSYKRIRVAYIESARKRPEEFQKRLSNFIRKTKDNKLIKGFGGIEKYY